MTYLKQADNVQIKLKIWILSKHINDASTDSSEPNDKGTKMDMLKSIKNKQVLKGTGAKCARTVQTYHSKV